MPILDHPLSPYSMQSYTIEDVYKMLVWHRKKIYIFSVNFQDEVKEEVIMVSMYFIHSGIFSKL